MRGGDFTNWNLFFPNIFSALLNRTKILGKRGTGGSGREKCLPVRNTPPTITDVVCDITTQNSLNNHDQFSRFGE